MSIPTGIQRAIELAQEAERIQQRLKALEEEGNSLVARLQEIDRELKSINRAHQEAFARNRRQVATMARRKGMN